MAFTNGSDIADVQHTFTAPSIGADHAADPGGQAVFTFIMPSVPTAFFCRIHNVMTGTITPS